MIVRGVVGDLLSVDGDVGVVESDDEDDGDGDDGSGDDEDCDDDDGDVDFDDDGGDGDGGAGDDEGCWTAADGDGNGDSVGDGDGNDDGVGDGDRDGVADLRSGDGYDFFIADTAASFLNSVTPMSRDPEDSFKFSSFSFIILVRTSSLNKFTEPISCDTSDTTPAFPILFE